MNGQRLTDDICRSVLQRAHRKIVEEMYPDIVLDKLRDRGFLSHQDYTAIKGVSDKPTKNRSLVGKIRQSGKRAYCDFKTILEETGQKKIIIELELKEKELGIETAEQVSAEPERMVTDQQTETPARILQPTELNSLDDLYRSRTVTVTTTITNDLQDGRLIELDNKSIDDLKSVSSTNDTLVGGFGRVYISKKPVEAFGIRVVLKEIDMGRQTGNQSLTQKLGSVTNEKIASRLMHFGIVPVLAYHDDNTNGKHYLLSPYLVNGDLFQAIAYDRSSRLDIRLKFQIRMKIMYQIASAIDFMHTGNEFRGPVLHMDIKTKNIVLDSKFNARLIDFGIARELKEDAGTLLVTSTNFGTPGYFSTASQVVVTKQNDYHSFGVVLLELITGLEPSAKVEGLELRKWHVNLINDNRQVSVWNAHKVVKEVAEIAVKCIASVTANDTITFEEMKNNLKKLCRGQSADYWATIEVDRCEICLVNERLKVGYDGHDTGSEAQKACTERIRICCSCMRNSFINPVKCHTCGEIIKPFINANWGAILVAGYDEKDGKVFKKDIREFKEVITSKVLPAMCINPANVIIPDEDMKGISAVERIDLAFDGLSRTDIQTLLFVYSGHHDDHGLDVGPNVKYPLNKICNKLIKWNENKPQFGKVIAFLDCCFPKNMNLNDSPLKLIQLNATAPTTEANADTTNGSPFLQNVMKAFTASANGIRCEIEGCKCSKHIQGNFITLYDLWQYLNEHNLCGITPHMNTKDIELKDTILAYNYKFKVQFKFTVQWHETAPHTIHVLPNEFKEFIQLKLKLAESVLKKSYGIDAVSSDVKSTFAKIISIEINTGPKTKHVQEIDSIELLREAWVSKRQLRCTNRILHNIDVNKPVGRCCFIDVQNIRDVHEAVLQKCKITEHQLTRPNLLEYMKRLQKETTSTEQKYKGYISALDMIIFQAEPQLRDNRLEIAFFDLTKGFTLAHINLKKIADN